jgi:hypothetical protein
MHQPKSLGVLRSALSAQSRHSYSKLLRCLVEGNSHLFEDSKTVVGFIRSRQWRLLYEWADAVVAQEHSTAAVHFAGHQIAALIRKYPFTADDGLGFDPQATAIKAFLVAEHRCKRVNQRLRLQRMLGRKKFARELFLAREWIRRVIGEEPDLNAIFDECDFGPGASIGVHGDATNLARKLLSQEWTVTPTALPYALAALWRNPHYRDLFLPRKEGLVCYDRDAFSESVKAKACLVFYNKVAFVPKTAKTYRSIAVEPLLNGFVQKGIDQVLRAKLCSYGLDLSQQAPNQELARQGSIGGFNPYATIDLRSASDSLSTELVRDLLPRSWFELLSANRAPSYSLNGEVKPYHKFVSMGNGFCFPLQTLIFSSIIMACRQLNAAPGKFRVYGDDIICTQSVALHALEVLGACGFRSNPDKTFIHGPFRESCGEDWFGGKAVRPVYLDEELSELRVFHVLHNGSLKHDLAREFWASARPLLRQSVPSKWRFMRREGGYRDEHMRWVRSASAECAFHVGQDEFLTCEHVRWDRDQQRWRWKEISTVPVEDRFQHVLYNNVQYIAVLKGASSSSPFTVRRKTRTRVQYC